MNHVTSPPLERNPRTTATETGYLELRHDSRERGKSLLATMLVVSATFIVVTPGLEFARSQPIEYAKFFLVVLGLALFFQKYYDAYCTAAGIAYSQLLKRKVLAWGTTFLFVTLVLVLTDLKGIPRSLSFFLISLSCVFDVAVSSVVRLQNPVREGGKGEAVALAKRQRRSLSYHNLVLSWLLLMLSLFSVMALKAEEVTLYSHYEQLIVVIVTSWLLATALTRPFNTRTTENIYFRIAPAWKLGCVTALLVSVFYLYGELEHLSRSVLFGTIVVFTVLQVVVEIVQALLGPPDPIEPDVSLAVVAGGSSESDADSGCPPRRSGFCLGEHLPRQVALDGREDLREFLNKDLPQVPAENVSILFSSEREDVRQLSEKTSVVINLEALNFVEHLNSYLATIYKGLDRDGYFVTWFYPIETMASRVRSQMPKSIFVIVYPFYFFVFRVVAKLPILGRFIFYVTRGRQSDISKAEILGRLAYAGFSVLQSRTINKRVYVIARADRTPIEDTEPSFGPIAKLEKIGLHGEKIIIYKIRTMYPYSEFIQKDVFASNGLDDNGKFMNDFRITPWGRVMRKYWIDELPQLYNWLRGDIALVGVRAISRHYFSLYSKEMQAMRLKTRPGLIPPLYADMPKNFPEIVESERRYILERSERPLTTDVKYLAKAFHNILFKGARSA